MSRLQRFQNTAARSITFTPKFDHISPVLFKLHWLPVKYRLQYKVGLLTFKAIHFKMPQYLSNLLPIKENNKYSLRSASNGLIVEDPTCRLKSHWVTDRSKHLPQPWNGLPRENVCQDVFLSCVYKVYAAMLSWGGQLLGTSKKAFLLPICHQCYPPHHYIKIGRASCRERV